MRIEDRADERQRMVERQIAARGVRNPRVLEAMAAVPREVFVPEELAEFAYEDGPLPIGADQTISQPYIVALMAELADPGPYDNVLEVGTGSGYAAAVLAQMAARVCTIERHPDLATTALKRLEWLGCDNVHVRCGDGTLGWPEMAPFDAIVVAAGGPAVPRSLHAQLAIGGRLVIPVSEDGFGQKLLRLHRTAEETFEEEDCGAVAFVPLIGAEGWHESERELPDERPAARRLGAGTAPGSGRGARRDGADRRRGRAAAGFCRSGVRAARRSLRRCARRVAGRGHAWHLGVLPGARRDHQAPDHRARLQRDRGGGGLA